MRNFPLSFRLFVLSMVAAVMVWGTLQAGQTKKEESSAHKIIHYGDLKWTPIIPGWEMATVSGDSSKDGEPFVIRLRGADGSKVPPHWHPTDENVTVLKGTFLVGMGESYDDSKLLTMNVGNFTLMPKEVRHFANCKSETIIQVHGLGPFKVNWVNPADAPMPPAKP